jgi:putative ABC transport system permease protein
VLFFFYAYRSMLARIRANALTMVAVLLLVTGSTLALSFYEGLRAMLVDTTPPENIVVLAQGAAGEGDSKLSLDAAHKLVLLPGIKKDGGTPLAVRELVTRVYLDQSSYNTPVVIRGIDDKSLAVHHVKIVEGAAPAVGSLEVVLGKRVAQNYPTLKIGDTIGLPAGQSKVTGIMAADGNPFEDEVWTPRGALELHLKVQYSSSMTLVAEDPAQVAALVDQINTNKDLASQAMPAAKLLTKNANLDGIARLVLILLVLLSIVATFAIATTMNAAAAVRMPELAALAAIGIYRRTLGRIVLLESVLLAGIGALIGAVVGVVVRSRIGSISLGANPVQMSGTSSLVLIGVGLGLAVGFVGGLSSAVKVARLDIMHAMR